MRRPVGAALYPQSHHDPALAAALRASLAEQQRASAAAANEARTRAALVESLEVRFDRPLRNALWLTVRQERLCRNVQLASISAATSLSKWEGSA